MAQWIETKLRYQKINEHGALKKTTESYLVDALSFTEAEARIIEEMQPFISGEFTVSAVKKTNVAEVFTDFQGDRWYLVKVGFETVNEKTGTMKTTPAQMLVQAYDFDEALVNFKESMKGTMADYRILSISETAIMDIFPVKLSESK